MVCEDSIRSIRKWYDNLSNVYDRLYGPEQLLKAFKIKKYLVPGSILDLGCGTGIIYVILGKDREIWGVDISPRMLKKFKQRIPHAKVILRDILKLNLNKKFDNVISLSVLQDINLNYVYKFLDVVFSHSRHRIIISFIKKDAYIKKINCYVRRTKNVKVREILDDKKDIIYILDVVY